MSVGLFTTEIYANWVRKEELERWFLKKSSKLTDGFLFKKIMGKNQRNT